jgi:apolipoprotein N-acyltransferase
VKRIPGLWFPIVSGILLALSFPPFDLVFLPFVALVPLLLFIERARSSRQLIWGGIVGGLVFWIALLYWVSIFSVAGFIALMVYLTLFILFFVLGLEFLSTRALLPVWLVGPALWIGLEHFRAIGELAFTWGQLNTSLSYHPLLLQSADIAGPYGVSFWIVLVNCLIFEVATRRDRRVIPPIATLLLVLLVPIIYGYRCLDDEELLQGEEIDISLIQPNIDQERKWSRSFRDSTLTILEDLSAEALLSRPDLIVWPETAVPAYLRHHEFYQRRISNFVRDSGVPYLVGSQDYDRIGKDEFLTYNSAFLMRKDGRLDENRYSKIRLVPFGEKLPYEKWIPGLREIEYGGGHFSPGEEFTLFEFDGFRFGVLICFESIFPDLSREFCLQGAGFLLNITNDAWFLRTSAPYQHASALPLRAIENRIYIARSANTGISMIVDPMGRVLESTPIFERKVISGEIRARTDTTFYRRHGDLIVYLAWIVLLAGVIRFLRKRKSPDRAA